MIYIYIFITFIVIITILLAIYGSLKHKNINEKFIDNENNVYVFRGHKCDEQLIKMWEKAHTELDKNKCFLLFDNTNNGMNDDFYEKYKDYIILHTLDQCKEINKLHDSMWVSVETPICIAYDYIKDKVNFEYLWLIETDIYLDGSFDKCLEYTDGNKLDYIAVAVEDFKQYVNDDWVHWNFLKGDIKDIPYEERVKSFLPLIRCSKNLLEVLKENMGKSSGFCELYFPTIAKKYGLTYGNLPDEIIGDFHMHETVRLSTLPKNDDNKL
jgi:hypothetical protein